MRGEEVVYLLYVYSCALYNHLGSEALRPLQVVPQGIESVNGSNITMGCASPLVERDGVMVCDNSESYLVDGCSPAINASTSNWASQLVTLRKNEANDVIDYDHVVLIFDFDTALSPDSIELDLFLCPEWNIGAPGIFVYAYQNSTLVFNPATGDFLIGRVPSQSQLCDTLSTVTIAVGERVITSYHSFHIVVDFTFEDTEWVHVGEVRFFSDDITNPSKYIQVLMSLWHTHVYQRLLHYTSKCHLVASCPEQPTED